MEHLIPPEWFDGMTQWMLLLIFAASMLVVIKGADWLVEGMANLAYRMGISKIVVAATILSLGTTSPETAVSVSAAWSGNPGLALGNAVGSVIADTGLILGLGCVIAILPADRFVLLRQGAVQISAGLLLAGICYGSWLVMGEEAALGRWVGVLFLSLLVGYIAISIRWGKQHAAGEPFMPVEEIAPPAPQRSYLYLSMISLVGLVLVIFASQVLINSASELAEQWEVPQVVIAATIVALGTSLPELVIGMTSIYRGHREVLVGNVIGADILNILWVTGAAAVAAPLRLTEPTATYPQIFLFLHLPTMVFVLLMFLVFIALSVRRGQFRRWYGVPLLVVYVAYIVLQFALSRPGAA
jgi:cation:H+ antiporter